MKIVFLFLLFAVIAQLSFADERLFAAAFDRNCRPGPGHQSAQRSILWETYIGSGNWWGTVTPTGDFVTHCYRCSRYISGLVIEFDNGDRFVCMAQGFWGLAQPGTRSTFHRHVMQHIRIVEQGLNNTAEEENRQRAEEERQQREEEENRRRAEEERVRREEENNRRRNDTTEDGGSCRVVSDCTAAPGIWELWYRNGQWTAGAGRTGSAPCYVCGPRTTNTATNMACNFGEVRHGFRCERRPRTAAQGGGYFDFGTWTRQVQTEDPNVFTDIIGDPCNLDIPNARDGNNGTFRRGADGRIDCFLIPNGCIANHRPNEAHTACIPYGTQPQDILDEVTRLRGNVSLTGDQRWFRHSDGTFNHLRFWVSTTAAVAGGTAAGILTHNLVRANQIRRGHEGIECVFGGGGQTVTFGETFTVR